MSVSTCIKCIVRDKDGVKQWKRVEVKLKDHINVPVFPEGKSLDSYDEYFNDYLSKIAMDQLPQSQPLWEIHIIKYPTINAAGNIVFKLHHALGDGFSLMGALLSCLQRADNPSLPITFPAFQMNPKSHDNFFSSVPRILSGFVNTVSDFGWSLLKSSFVRDDRTPIRSGDDGVELRPISITTLTFSLEHIKQIKASLDVTINDVICGIIFLATRLYMEAENHKLRNANSTALVLINTRNIGGYKSVEEMVKPHTETTWGNQFAFLHVSVPELEGTGSANPIDFVYKAQKIIRRKRNSAVASLTGSILETMRKYRGSEATARYVHSTLKNSSMTISNVIGPVEQLALANQPVAGMYFMVVGAPQSLSIGMLSYMRSLRVAVGMEKGLINSQKFKSCIENAYDMMFNAALQGHS